MIELIRYDCIFWSKHCLEEPGICIESRWVKDCILQLVEGGYLFLQLLVNVLSSANEADATHPETVSIYGMFGSSSNSRVIRET